jgi:putative ABC transport system permease protein
MTIATLDVIHLAAAASLILINGALSVAFGLGLERRIAIAAVRMVIQIGVIGLALAFVFTHASLLATAAAAMALTLMAAYEVWAQQDSSRAKVAVFGLGLGALLPAGLVAATYGSTVIAGAQPWYAPHIFIPILGLVLGTALTGIGLALSTALRAARGERGAIEARLAHGAGRFTAMNGVVALALKDGLMPVVNAMSVFGLVAIPSFMSGQMLAGVAPLDAAKYQIALMFVVASATALGVTLAALGSVLLLTDRRDRLRLDRLATP